MPEPFIDVHSLPFSHEDCAGLMAIGLEAELAKEDAEALDEWRASAPRTFALAMLLKGIERERQRCREEGDHESVQALVVAYVIVADQLSPPRRWSFLAGTDTDWRPWYASQRPATNKQKKLLAQRLRERPGEIPRGEGGDANQFWAPFKFGRAC
jgi:hypothetical protein